MVCPICGGEVRHLFSKDDFGIAECIACGHRMLEQPIEEAHVAAVYADDYFTKGGAGYPGYLLQSEILKSRGRYYADIVARHMAPGKVLDVGAASGFILQGFMDKGWTGLGVEPNESMAAHGRDKLHLPVVTGALENFVTDQKFDLVSMIQVLPHFYDLDKALAAAMHATTEDGYWLCEIWNRGSYTARFLGPRWQEYSPPSVLRWFAPRDLAIAARKYGFNRIASGRPRRWVQGAHAKSLLKGKFASMGFIGRVATRLVSIIPDNLNLPYPSEDLYWALFRRMAPANQTVPSAVAQAAE